MQQISSNVYQVKLGMVNAFIIEDKNGLTLVDTGYPNSTDKIFDAIKKAGKNPNEIQQVILTHSHPDHAGSAAEIKRRLNIPVFAHAEDTKLIEQGVAGRMPFVLTPGIINWLVFNLLIKRGENSIEALKIDQQLQDNDILPIAGGVQVIHTPGHCLGHVALLVKNDGVLIAGDIAANVMGLALSTVYEDRAIGIQSILKAASYDFSKAVFGHGNPITKDANQKFKETFANAS